jgi:hypothetical protein
MLNILGSQKRLCDGFSRREMIQPGASGLLGVDVERSIPDRQSRPMPLVDGGQLVPEILA